jgi:hypothetical protein
MAIGTNAAWIRHDKNNARNMQPPQSDTVALYWWMQDESN